MFQQYPFKYFFSLFLSKLSSPKSNPPQTKIHFLDPEEVFGRVYADEIINQSSELKNAVSPSSGIPIGGGLTYSRTTEIDRRNLFAKHRNFNPDVPPYQHWILKSGYTDIQDPVFREKLYFASSLLQKLGKGKAWKIVNRGWYYSEPNDPDTIYEGIKPSQVEEEALPNGEVQKNAHYDLWSDELEDAFIDSFRAFFIGTTFIVRWENGSYSVFTQNDVMQPSYGNKYHELTEVYFLYPFDNSQLLSENENEPYSNEPVGFLTQYSETPTRPSRKFPGKTLYKDCVMIQPLKWIHDVFGIPYYMVELSTATQRIYLRSYAFAHLHSGGVRPMIGVASGTDSNVAKNLLKSMNRGIWNRGFLITLEGGLISDSIEFQSMTYPDLKIRELNELVSEDATMTQQKIKGMAETGALGGSAPEVNRVEDLEEENAILYICSKIIKDINETFFGIEQWKYEIKEDGRKVRTPLYDVVFYKPNIEESSGMDESLHDEKGGTDGNVEGTEKPESPADERKAQKTELNPPENTSENPKSNVRNQLKNYKSLSDITAYTHSISEDHITFEGNMFQAGAYMYTPEETEDGKEKVIYITDQDIERLCNRSVRQGYLGFDHATDFVIDGLAEGVGNYEIIEHNKIERMDRTRFNIRKKYYDQLKQAGYIRTVTILVDGKNVPVEFIKISPVFHMAKRKDGSGHEIFVKKVDIVPPWMMPRAEKMGLRTQAQRVE